MTFATVCKTPPGTLHVARSSLVAGDYGKLGHGNSSTQKYPKLVQGALTGKVLIASTCCLHLSFPA